MNDEQLAIETLKALGAKDTSSPSQIKRGTTCFTLPTGDCVSVITRAPPCLRPLGASGYIRDPNRPKSIKLIFTAFRTLLGIDSIPCQNF